MDGETTSSIKQGRNRRGLDNAIGENIAIVAVDVDRYAGRVEKALFISRPLHRRYYLARSP